MMNLFRTKQANEIYRGSGLIRSLTAFDVTLLGIGAVIGAGVFVLTGVAAATQAGPGITLSYVLSGMAALFAALSYAELSSSVGGSGSAYTYAYASVGEIFAWIIGWALILEYAMSISTVAVGWSGYVVNALQSLHVHIPVSLCKTPFEGGGINLPGMFIIGVLMFLLHKGTRQSMYVNTVVVIIKLLAIAMFIAIGATHIDIRNWTPFFPFGASGVAHGAALVFFAYVGFDAISTAAEETIRPQRNLPIGLVLSLTICTLIYIVVAGVLTGLVPFTKLNVPSPVSHALLEIGYHKAAGLIAIGAIAGLTSVMLVMFYGATRILYAISRDGLLPKFFSYVDPVSKTPTKTIFVLGAIMALTAGFAPLTKIAELVNIGTLAAFVFVCSGVIILRKRQPDLARPFKLPGGPIIPLLGIIFCIYLMSNLSMATWMRFGVWLVIGLGVYFGYGRRKSLLNNNKPVV